LERNTPASCGRMRSSSPNSPIISSRSLHVKLLSMLFPRCSRFFPNKPGGRHKSIVQMCCRAALHRIRVCDFLFSECSRSAESPRRCEGLVQVGMAVGAELLRVARLEAENQDPACGLSSKCGLRLHFSTGSTPKDRAVFGVTIIITRRSG
jgi:hypothetical protein